MLHFCTTTQHTYTMGVFLRGWGAALAPRIRVHTYAELLCRPVWPAGTWIFADLERLAPEERTALAPACQALRAAGRTVLNDPATFPDRIALAQCLAGTTSQQGKLHTLDGAWDAVRLPAFIRCADDHKGAVSGLVYERDELLAWQQRLRREPSPGRMVAIEYVDYRGPGGLYHKYGAYVLRDRILPAHRVSGTSWMLKSAEDLGPESIDAEAAFLRDNPHRDLLLPVARAAGIGFGRIDYAFVEGRLHVFEINSNPSLHLVHPPDHPRYANCRLQHLRIARALADLDETASSTCHGVAIPHLRWRPLALWAAVRSRRRAEKRKRDQLQHAGWTPGRPLPVFGSDP